MNGEGPAIFTRVVGGVGRLRHGAMVHHPHDQPSIVKLNSCCSKLVDHVMRNSSFCQMLDEDLHLRVIAEAAILGLESKVCGMQVDDQRGRLSLEFLEDMRLFRNCFSKYGLPDHCLVASPTKRFRISLCRLLVCSVIHGAPFSRQPLQTSVRSRGVGVSRGGGGSQRRCGLRLARQSFCGA